MTLEQLDQALSRWSDYPHYISYYSLREDEGFIKLLVNGATKPELLAYLQEEYPEHFEDYGNCDTCNSLYDLSSREGRCGDCGECAEHCDHETNNTEEN